MTSGRRERVEVVAKGVHDQPLASGGRGPQPSRELRSERLACGEGGVRLAPERHRAEANGGASAAGAAGLFGGSAGAMSSADGGQVLAMAKVESGRGASLSRAPALTSGVPRLSQEVRPRTCRCA